MNTTTRFALVLALLTVSSWAFDGLDVSADKFFNQQNNNEGGGNALMGMNYADNSGVSATVNPDEYVLGQGDRLVIYVSGAIEASYNAGVTPEGTVLVPSCGEIDIKGESLSGAKKTIATRIRAVYKNATIAVSLIKLRSFHAGITGQVARPGSYVVNGAMRVSDLIEMANGKTQPFKRRGIQIKNDTGIVLLADLALFYNYGDISGNPYLQENQIIHVPSSGFILGAFEAVGYPGMYNYMPGDKLGTIIKIAGGLSINADSSRILLVRFADNIDRLDTILLSLPKDENFPIQPNDRIVFSLNPDYRRLRNVNVEGEVRFPGTYPIRENQTRLDDIIAMAGGLTDKAYLKASYIIRQPGNKSIEKNFNTPEASLNIISSAPLDPNSIRPEEYAFFKSKITEPEGKLSIDLNKALANKDDVNNIILQDEDLIYISPKVLAVRVMGSVPDPGLIEYLQGKNASYYIAFAGGYGKNADIKKTVIKKCGAGTWTKPDDAPLSPGDIILVPERRYRDPSDSFRDAISFIASTLSIAISSLTIYTLIAK
jgi:protein involved in polysaccharide export with SLBB domain